MVAVNPTWIDGVAVAGTFLRRGDSVLTMHNGAALGARSGIIPGTGGLGVSVAGTTITVGSGIALVYYAGEGVFRASMTSSSTLTLQAAHATLTRIDLVYLRIWCNSVDGSGMNKADVDYLPGTASSTPVAPTPTGTVIYMPLATITVPPVGGGSASVSSAVRPYTVAPGGILPLQSSAPTSPYVGQFYDDQTNLRRWNGSTWETMQKVETVNWTTPTLGTGYTQGSGTNGNGNGPIRYRTYVDRGTSYIEWDGSANRTAGAQTTNILNAALATALRPTYRATVVVARNATSITGVSNSSSVVHSMLANFNPDGTISLVGQDAGNTEAVWFTLRGIRYPLS
ncbi:hypothetical protein ACFC08_35495 [Streptomyces sp. NPDC056112]|uniref:hypothetical protein n=1 Tax=Streptomyces sp. NPDC056112 TaxID=3345715 RepID=UPI0035D75F98